MKRLAGGFVTAVAILVALVVLRWYWRSQGARDAQLEQEDATHQHTIDSLRVRAARAESVEVILRQQVSARGDSLAVLKRRRTRQQQVVDTARVRGDTAALIVGLDSVNSVLLDENRQLTEQVTLWRTMYESADMGRRALHDALHESERLRENWKHRAQRRFACVGGVGVGVSLTGHAAAPLTLACGIRL